MKKLDHTLQEWVSQKLLSEQQANAITEYEAGKTIHSWAFISVLSLGALVIGLGLISLVAANWAALSPLSKLTLDFALLVILCLCCGLAKVKQKPFLFEISLLIYFISLLASIALIAQVYQTGGEFYQALLVWSLITAGLALVSEHSLLPFIWVSGLLSSLFFCALSWPAWQIIFHHNSTVVVMAMPLLASLLTLTCEHLKLKSSLHYSFYLWILFSGLLALIYADLNWHHPGKTLTTVKWLQSFSPIMILTLASAMALIMHKTLSNAQKCLLTVLLIVYLCLFQLPLSGAYSEFIGALMSLSLLALAALYFASANQQRTFSLCMLVLGVRVIILYFQAFGGLAKTGAGLIVAGILIIALVVLWRKYQAALNRFAKELMHA